MNSSEFSRFESLILSDIHLQPLWSGFSPHLNSTVEDVEKARFLYSNALKITRYVAKDEKMLAVWLDVLRQGSFMLALKGAGLCKYDFKAILELTECGKDEFEIELLQIDPKKDDLLAIAKLIHCISLESVGEAAEIEFYRQILASKDTLCLIAKANESLVACFYGTHLTLNGVNLFHLNLLGRRIEYPSLCMVENLRNQLTALQQRYPVLHYLTLCVAVKNSHMISVYEKEGFQKCGYHETGTMGFPVYFYSKKIDPSFDKPMPSYDEFQTAMKLKREQQKKESQP